MTEALAAVARELQTANMIAWLQLNAMGHPAMAPSVAGAQELERIRSEVARRMLDA